MTYPTSYEALVGRAKLQAGAHAKPVVDDYPQYFTQVNGYSCWLPQEALEWPPSKSEEVCQQQCCPSSLPVSDRSDLGVRVALGAHVIACASPSKLDVARTMGGADFVVDYTRDGWQKEVLKITGGRGVDVVYDPVGRIRGAIPFTER
jgi:Zinc-binding dehydrogenase